MAIVKWIKKYERRVQVIPTPLKKTNADRIRSMSDEELAEWVNSPCPPSTLCDLNDNYEPNCKDCWLAWLKQDANNA